MKQSCREIMSFTFLSGNLFQMDTIAQTLRALRILPLNALKEFENQPAGARRKILVSCILSPVQEQNPLAQNG